MRPLSTRQPAVLHVLEAIAAGVARHVVDVVSHTAGYRHEVALPHRRKGWTTDDYVVGALRDAGAEVHFVDMRRMPFHPVNAVAVRRLRRLLATRAPVIVHGHSSIGGALARAAAWSAPVARVYTPHALNPARAAIAVERALGRRTDRLVALSESERQLVSELGLVPADRIALIPNGIDVAASPGDAPDIRAALGLPPATPLVGCVARVVAQKAPDDFARTCVEVASSCPDAHFVLVGTGPKEGEVDRIANEAGVSTWHRVTNMPDAWRVMGQFDVFVLPSRYEGLPYAPLEAMRAGTPVVLTDVAGNREVAAGGACVLVPPGDVDGLARAVVGLLCDPARRAAQGALGRAAVEARFRVETMGAALAALYDELSLDQVNHA